MKLNMGVGPSTGSPRQARDRQDRREGEWGETLRHSGHGKTVIRNPAFPVIASPMFSFGRGNPGYYKRDVFNTGYTAQPFQGCITGFHSLSRRSSTCEGIAAGDAPKTKTEENLNLWEDAIST